MQNAKHYIVFLILLGLFAIINFRMDIQGYAHLDDFRGADLVAEEWNPVIAGMSNESKLTVSIDGRQYTNLSQSVYMDDCLHIRMDVGLIGEAFNCSAHVYDNKMLMVEKREDVIKFSLGENNYICNEKTVDAQEEPLVVRAGTWYISLPALTEALGFTYQWDVSENSLTALNTNADSDNLPYRYDLREKGRAPKVKDQGSFGTCWAFASLAALESAQMPEHNMELSVDHMNHNNSFASPTKDGGQYTMAMAYLAAWQGPVYEKDDPYGDGVSDASLKEVLHVQDMQILESKDLVGIKEAVFKYGGVETCIYTTMSDADGSSGYYNEKENAYCYVGEEKPNHDIVIIGWDDNFPRDCFNAELEGDGAFLCQNSWGEEFGDDGVFYVSYYDTNIGIHNLVYTGVSDTDNFSRIYQSDLCGWVGQMGYNKESIYGANVFEAKSDETLLAAGFYAVGKETSYKIYIVPEFTGEGSLGERKLVAEGQFKNAGYHTVMFEQEAPVKKGKRFAVVVWLSTPNVERPLAIEYAADELTQNVDISDGEGYVSSQGSSWTRAEESSKCNLCIKAYAK